MEKNYEEEIKKLRKQKLLYQLEKEINDLEKEIKYQKIKNLKTHIIRNMKISANIVRLFTPYTITLLLTTTGCKAITGGYPFIRDNTHKIAANITKEIDNLGNIYEKKQYGMNKKEKDELYLYTNWEYDQSTENYTRDVEKYELYNLNENIIEDLITLDVDTIKEMFGNPEYQLKETTNNITEEEKEETMKAIIHTKDTKDYILTKEPIMKNILVSTVYIFILITGEFIVLLFIELKGKFDFREEKEQIKIKHPYINKEINLKKLEIKKDNYNRLTRE